MKTHGILLAIIGLIWPNLGLAYEEYIINYEPLKSSPGVYEQYMQYTDEVMNGHVSVPLFKQRIAIIESALSASPDWIDGMWLLAADTFQMAALLTESSHKQIALDALKKGEEATERCLKLSPGHVVCELFLGTSLAHRGTIEGVLDSLSNAERVEKLWLHVAQSKYNLKFTHQVTMQGAVRYALGIFYRLVPDLAVLDWMYGVRGNIQKSIKFHRESLAIDDPNLPCSNLMLGVSLICSAKGAKDKAWQEGMSFLKATQATTKIYTVNSIICRNDAGKLMKKPDDACEYSVVGQQQPANEEYFNTKNPKQKLSH